MRRQRLPGYLGVRVPLPIQEAITTLADKKELAIAELARDYITEGLRRDGVLC